MERKLKIVKPAGGPYDAWLSKMDTAVEAECAKLRKRAPKRTPESESLDLDLAKMRRERMSGLLSDVSQLLVAADDLARGALPLDSKASASMRSLIGNMRELGGLMDTAFQSLPMSEFVKVGDR